MKGDIIYVIRSWRDFVKSDQEELMKVFGSPSHNIPGMQSFSVLQQITDGPLSFRHFGIDIGDGTVVHFTGEKAFSKSNLIQHTSLDKFLKGGDLEVDLATPLTYKRDEIVERALSKVGSDFGGYNLFDNNCEHFANWCARGRKTSRQINFKNDDMGIIEKASEIIIAEPLAKFADKLERFVNKLPRF
ncbi:lecithin retinol acyltransferase family protein [Pseudoneobacillus sp. C159]